MKLVGYDTSKAHTTDIVKSMLVSCNGELKSIASFERDGLPDCDLIVISGILRGTGLVYKACVEQKRNFVFIDQPYDSTFNDYGNDNFTKQNQIELFEYFKKSKNKCLMVVGGSEFIKDLYKDFIVYEYPKKYSFKIYAGRIGDEINVNHLVVTNYKND